MFGLTLSTVLFRIVAMLVVVAIAGFLAALIARLLGDRGPSDDGKLTLNPFEHLDLLAAVPFILFGAGWIKPPAVDHGRLRPQPVVGAAVTAIGALAGTVAILALVWNLRRFGLILLTDASAVNLVEGGLRVTLEVSLWFGLLNLVPVPPLLGGFVLGAISPLTASVLRRHAIPVGIAIIVVLATGIPQQFARPAYDTLLRLLGA